MKSFLHCIHVRWTVAIAICVVLQGAIRIASAGMVVPGFELAIQPPSPNTNAQKFGNGPDYSLPIITLVNETPNSTITGFELTVGDEYGAQFAGHYFNVNPSTSPQAPVSGPQKVIAGNYKFSTANVGLAGTNLDYTFSSNIIGTRKFSFGFANGFQVEEDLEAFASQAVINSSASAKAQANLFSGPYDVALNEYIKGQYPYVPVDIHGKPLTGAALSAVLGYRKMNGFGDANLPLLANGQHADGRNFSTTLFSNGNGSQPSGGPPLAVATVTFMQGTTSYKESITLGGPASYDSPHPIFTSTGAFTGEYVFGTIPNPLPAVRVAPALKFSASDSSAGAVAAPLPSAAVSGMLTLALFGAGAWCHKRARRRSEAA